MWHQDLLNQEVENLIRRVIICQKIVRGYLCRKRLLVLLNLVEKQKQENYQFIHSIHLKSLSLQNKMDQSNRHVNYGYKTRVITPLSAQHPLPPPPPPPQAPTSTKINVASDNYRIQNLKNKIENQMRSYAKQEEYDEMLKLVKKLNCVSNEKWHEVETEVEKLEQSEPEYRSSAALFTDNEIAVLTATDLVAANKRRTKLNKLNKSKPNFGD